jgi:hypothetical protein
VSRSSPAPELVEFSAERRAPIVTVMRSLLHDRDGWINLQPAVYPEDLPDPAPVLTRVFSPRGPEVPLGTWVPGARKRGGRVEPVSLGLQHHGGPKALWRLRDAGHPMPSGWRMLADHPRRGLVLEVPADEDPDVTLVWIIRAAGLLSEVELPDTWHAGVFRR